MLEARELNFYIKSERVTAGAPDQRDVPGQPRQSGSLRRRDRGNPRRNHRSNQWGDTTPHRMPSRAGASPTFGGAFMDDTYFCEKSPQYVQALLPELERRLSLLGLKINPKKTQVISNRRDDSTTFIIGGVRVQPGVPGQ